MPAAEPLSLRIEFDRGTTPVSGRLATGVGAPATFSGWTELFAALHAAIAETAPKSCIDESTRDPEVRSRSRRQVRTNSQPRLGGNK